MTTLPVSGYMSNAARTEGEMKTAFENLRDVTAELLGGAVESELTIAAGAVTPTAGVHSVDTEADAASDDLDTIAQTNHPDGRLLLVRCADNARSVVVKHASGGTGQVFLVDATAFTLSDTTMWLLLQRRTTSWYEVMRGHGANKAGARAFLAAAGTGDANVFTKTPTWKKGSDVASASALTLGDGNAFDVTGNVAIASINTKGAGTLAILRFTGTPTVTHHATNLVLPHGKSIVAAAGDRGLFHEYATGLWECAAWVPAGALNLFDAVLKRAKLQDYEETETSVSSVAGTLTLDLETGNVFYTTLTEHVTTLAITNKPAAAWSLTLKITQDVTPRTFDWADESVEFGDAGAPDITTASGVYTVALAEINGTLHGFLAQAKTS